MTSVPLPSRLTLLHPPLQPLGTLGHIRFFGNHLIQYESDELGALGS